VGILTSQNPDTLEGLRIPTELPHSTELELRKLRRTRMDFSRASALKLLRGLPTSQEVLRPSEPHLSLYSIKIEFGIPLEGAKPHFVHTFCRGEHRGIYRRSKTVLWPKIWHVRPTCLDFQTCNLVGWPCFLLAPPLGRYLEHRLCRTCKQYDFWKCANTCQPAKVMWLAGHTLARLSPCFVPHHFLVSYFL
jgi:hypothetical protein